MIQVGTQQGTAWNFNEGQGEASLFQTPLTDNFMSRMAEFNFVEMRRRKAAEDDDFQKRVDALSKAHQEMDFRVQDTTRDALMSFLDDAAKYKVATGRNPFLAGNRDPKAREFQMAYQKLATLPESIQQVAGRVKEYQNAILTDPSKYTDESIQMYKDPDLMQLVKQGNVPAPELKAPLANLAKEVMAIIPKNTPFTGVLEVAPELASGLLTNPGVVNSVQQGLKHPEVMAHYSRLAQESGIPVEQAYLQDYVMKMAEPGWTEASFEQGLHQEIRSKTGKYVNEEGGYGPYVSKAVDNMARLAVTDPRWVAAMEQKYPGMPLDQVLAREKKEWRKLDWGDTRANPKDKDGNGDGVESSRMRLGQVLDQIDRSEPAAEGFLAGQRIVLTGQDASGKVVPAVDGQIVSIKRDTSPGYRSPNLAGMEDVVDPGYVVDVVEEVTVNGVKTKKAKRLTMQRDQLMRATISASPKVLGPKQGQVEAQGMTENIGAYD